MRRILERVDSSNLAWLALLVNWAAVAVLIPLPGSIGALSILSYWTSSASEATSVGLDLLIAVPLLALLFLVVDRRTKRSIWVTATLIVCYALLAISGLKSAPGLIWPVLMLLPIVVALLSVRDAKQIASVLFWILMVQSAVSAILYLIAYEQFRSPGFGIRASGFFYTPNGLYQLTAAGFLLSMTRLNGLRRVDAVFALCCLLCGVVTVWTYTRGALLGLGAGILVFSFFRPLRIRWLVAAIALSTICFAFTVRAGNGGDRAEKSVTGRLSIWHDSVGLWLHRPWLGSGQGAFVRAAPNLPSKSISSIFPNEPKSLYLNLLLEGGVVGFALFLGASASIFWQAVKIAKSTASEPWMRHWAEGTACYLSFLAVAGITDTPIFGDDVRVPATFTWALVCGVTLSITADNRKKLCSTPRIPDTNSKL